MKRNMIPPQNNKNSTTPTRPALRYHGGKWRLAPFIIQHFPPHTCYVEPFGGAASVLLRKTPAHIEVYNDLNGDVVNFFRILRERSMDLIAAINLTPYSRREFLQAQESCADGFEAARRFYVWSWQGRGRAGVKEPGGWRFMSRNTRSQTPVYDWNNNQHLWAVVGRLKEVQIENGDALTIIKRYDTPETLYYIDPPYIQNSRGKRWGSAAYVNEYKDEQHWRLSDVLHSLKGMAILSGYPSALYDELYKDWWKVERKACKDNGVKAAVECLWLSPSCREAKTNKTI